MLDRIQYSYVFGYQEKDGPGKERLQETKELFQEHLISSTTVKSIKIWFGTPPGKDFKAILAIQVKYINYITGKKEETRIQGAKIEGVDVEVKELEVNEGDYLSKFNIGFEDYINHIKFTTKKEKSIEFGNIIEANERQSVKDINDGNNIILNIRGFFSSNGVRALGCDYMSFNNFCFIRLVDIFRLKSKIEKEGAEKYTKDMSKLNDAMKCVLKLCLLPKNQFFCIIKYI